MSVQLFRLLLMVPRGSAAAARVLARAAGGSQPLQLATTTTNRGGRGCFFSTQPEPAQQTQPAPQESFLTGTSSIYVEQMLERYERDPALVHASWRQYFDNLAKGIAFEPADYNKPTVVVVDHKNKNKAAASADSTPSDSLGVAHLIRAY